MKRLMLSIAAIAMLVPGFSRAEEITLSFSSADDYVISDSLMGTYTANTIKTGAITWEVSPGSTLMVSYDSAWGGVAFGGRDDYWRGYYSSNISLTTSFFKGCSLKQLSFNMGNEGQLYTVHLVANGSALLETNLNSGTSTSETKQFFNWTGNEFISDKVSINFIAYYDASKIFWGDLNVKYEPSTQTNIGEFLSDQDETQAEYYDLTGCKLENPRNGVFIRLSEGKATKIKL